MVEKGKEHKVRKTNEKTIQTGKTEKMEQEIVNLIFLLTVLFNKDVTKIIPLVTRE